MLECGMAAMSEEYADFIARGVEISNLTAEQCYQRISSYYGTVYTPLDTVGSLQIRKYPYNSIPALYGLLETDIRVREIDVSDGLDAAGITRLQNIPTLRLRGQGCIAAIVDTGINIEDMAFRYTNGATRILRLWDMTDITGTPPEGIAYGSEYSQADIDAILGNRKREQSNAEDGADASDLLPGHDDYDHGNILAKAFAGNEGAVPEAYIVVVKLKEAKKYLRRYHGVRDDVPAYQENDIMLAINYVKELSRRMNMPVSLCLALGTNSRGHDGSSSLSYILDSFASTSEDIISVAGGAEGNKQIHSSDEENVEVRLDERQKDININIWGRGRNVISVGLTSPTGEVIEPIPARINSIEERQLLLEGTRVTIEYDLSEGDTGEQLVLIRLRDAIEGIWSIRIQGMPYYNAYLPLGEFIYEGTYFLRPNPDTTITDPAYSRKSLTAVSYDVTTGALYVGEGRGYSRLGAIKPDMASPVTVAILAGAVSQLQNWGIISDISLDSGDIKSYLIRGSNRDVGNNYPNNQWGYGKLNVYRAFEVLRSGQN